MGEEHLDLLPQAPRDDVFVGRVDLAGQIARSLVDRAPYELLVPFTIFGPEYLPAL